MDGEILPDTNIVIPWMTDEATILMRLGQAESIFLSSIVVGELYFGAFKSGRMEANLSRVETLLEGKDILTVDEETSRIYGRIKQELKLKGRPIPENDIWIAAHALQYDLTLITRDAHFSEVTGLRIEHW